MMENYLGNNDYKKEDELEALSYFIPIYKAVAGDFLEIIEVSERPDFICKRSDGALVGVEITRARRSNPNDVLYDVIVNKNINMVPDQAIDVIQTLINKKGEKIKAGDWKLSGKTILIIQLQESPLSELVSSLTESVFPDLPEYGFCEIWLADFSEIDAYDNIELLCLFPVSMRGYFKRPLQKPYG